ncbi:MAG: anion permease [Candidatus Eremiobacteraeota bacterium]|nr:anion permease [Candidatus Eremiobacteraeota bacterium]
MEAALKLRMAAGRPWFWASTAAAAVLLLRFEPLGGALAAIARQWNVLLFIAGLMGLSAAAEESGAFAWLTSVLLTYGKGSSTRLFVLLFVAGAVLTLALSNDATAVALTPVVYRAVVKRGIDAMPFLLASTFVADTASFGLPFANPANVLVLPHPDLAAYVLHLGPPQLAAIALNFGIFWIVFRKRLRGGYPPETLEPLSAGGFRTTIVLCGVTLAYFVALERGWPLGAVAAAGAVVALLAGRVAPRGAARHVSWSTLVLLAALFVVLDAAGRAGLFTDVLAWIERAAREGDPAATAIAAFGAAALSNLVNNLPVAAVAAYAVERAPSAHLAYALVAGVDLGPNLTVNGSLATILWVSALRRHGVRVDAWEYARLGLLVVPATVGVALAWLWFVR